MSFTPTQKSQIRAYLGFPDLYQYENPRLENAITVVEQDSAASAIVEALLVKIANVETAIDTKLSVAGLETVGQGDPGYYEGARLNELRKIGRGLCGKLSIKFGVPVINDYFSETGYGSDEWGNNGFQVGYFW